MNYIHDLEREIASLKARLKAKDDASVAFIMFLHSPKFVGEENGERKDWIATSDVIRWMIETNTNSIHAEEEARLSWMPRIVEREKAA
jgi:hypothetical protein